MHYHGQNLNEDRFGRKGSWIKNSRFWVKFGKGEEHAYAVTWDFGQSFFGARLELSPDDDDQISFHFAIPYVFAIWISRRFPWKHWIRRLLPKDERKIGIAIHDWTIWFSLWEKTMSWSSTDPKWWSFRINIPDTLFGAQKYSNVVLEERDVIIPMQEKAYRGRAEVFESTWKRPRWPFAKRMVRCKIDIPDGIPKPGKGTTDYNCGEDATYGITSPAKTVHEGIADLIESVLSSRERYGGRNWSPEPKTKKG